MNMEPGARKGIERIKRTIFKQLIIRESSDSIITIVSFTLAAYFKKIERHDLNILACSIAFLSNSICMFHNGFNFHKTSSAILRILNKLQQSPIAHTSSNSRSHNAYKRFRLIVPIGRFTINNSAFFALGLSLWGFISIHNPLFMAWVNPICAIMNSVAIVIGFTVGNYLFTFNQ